MDPNVLHNLSYGMYIVCSAKDGVPNGQVVNTAFQITSEPVTVAVSINKSNLTHEYISASSRFSITVLDEKAPLAFIGRFGFKSGRAGSKFDGIKFKTLPSGCPVVLDHSICYLEVKVANSLDCGTHTLFLGEVVDASMLMKGDPMTYAYYHNVKRGNTPKNAPTYIKGEKAGL